MMTDEKIAEIFRRS